MEDLITHSNSLYGLKLSYFEKVTKGFLSENHILVGGDIKYFLKKYRFDDKERIEEVHLVKKYFADRGIPVVLPLFTNDKKTFFFFNNGYYALFPFVEGRQPKRGSLADEAVISLGKMLGKMHLLGRKAALPVKERFKPWNKEKALEKMEAIHKELVRLPEYTDFDACALKNIEIKKKVIMANTMMYEDFNLPSDHLIHGDFLDHNVFFDDRNQVSHVFDFEKTDYSPRAYELFRSMIYSFFTINANSENKAKAKLYLDSYLQMYPMPKDELRRGFKLFYLKSIHSVWVESEHYLKNNTRVDGFLNDDYLRTEYLFNNYDAFGRELGI